MLSRGDARDALAVGVHGCVTISLAFADFYIRRNPHYVADAFIPGVVAGTYEAPFIYRPLTPLIIVGLSSVTGASVFLISLVVRAACIFAALVALHFYLRRWYSSSASLGGALGAAAFLPLTFTNSWQHPDTFPDLLLFTIGCSAIAGRRDGLLAAVVLLGTFNRETAIFLVLLWLLFRIPAERTAPALTKGAGLVLLWGIVYTGVRWVRGVKHYQYWMLPQNLALLNPFSTDADPRLRAMAYFWVVLAVFPGWLAWRGAHQPFAPRFFGCTLPVAVLFVVTALLFAAVIETRVFVPLIPLLLPPALAMFADISEHSADADRSARIR